MSNEWDPDIDAGPCTVATPNHESGNTPDVVKHVDEEDIYFDIDDARTKNDNYEPNRVATPNDLESPLSKGNGNITGAETSDDENDLIIDDAVIEKSFSATVSDISNDTQENCNTTIDNQPTPSSHLMPVVHDELDPFETGEWRIKPAQANISKPIDLGAAFGAILNETLKNAFTNSKDKAGVTSVQNSTSSVSHSTEKTFPISAEHDDAVDNNSAFLSNENSRSEEVNAAYNEADTNDIDSVSQETDFGDTVASMPQKQRATSRRRTYCTASEIALLKRERKLQSDVLLTISKVLNVVCGDDGCFGLEDVESISSSSYGSLSADDSLSVSSWSENDDFEQTLGPILTLPTEEISSPEYDVPFSDSEKSLTNEAVSLPKKRHHKCHKKHCKKHNPAGYEQWYRKKQQRKARELNLDLEEGELSEDAELIQKPLVTPPLREEPVIMADPVVPVDIEKIVPDDVMDADTDGEIRDSPKPKSKRESSRRKEKTSKSKHSKKRSGESKSSDKVSGSRSSEGVKATVETSDKDAKSAVKDDKMVLVSNDKENIVNQSPLKKKKSGRASSSESDVIVISEKIVTSIDVDDDESNKDDVNWKKPSVHSKQRSYRGKNAVNPSLMYKEREIKKKKDRKPDKELYSVKRRRSRSPDIGESSSRKSRSKSSKKRRDSSSKRSKKRSVERRRSPERREDRRDKSRKRKRSTSRSRTSKKKVSKHDSRKDKGRHRQRRSSSSSSTSDMSGSSSSSSIGSRTSPTLASSETPASTLHRSPQPSSPLQIIDDDDQVERFMRSTGKSKPTKILYKFAKSLDPDGKLPSQIVPGMAQQGPFITAKRVPLEKRYIRKEIVSKGTNLVVHLHYSKPTLKNVFSGGIKKVKPVLKNIFGDDFTDDEELADNQVSEKTTAASPVDPMQPTTIVRSKERADVDVEALSPEQESKHSDGNAEYDPLEPTKSPESTSSSPVIVIEESDDERITLRLSPPLKKVMSPRTRRKPPSTPPSRPKPSTPPPVMRAPEPPRTPPNPPQPPPETELAPTTLPKPFPKQLVPPPAPTFLLTPQFVVAPTVIPQFPPDFSVPPPSIPRQILLPQNVAAAVFQAAVQSGGAAVASKKDTSSDMDVSSPYSPPDSPALTPSGGEAPSAVGVGRKAALASSIAPATLQNAKEVIDTLLKTALRVGVAAQQQASNTNKKASNKSGGKTSTQEVVSSSTSRKRRVKVNVASLASSTSGGDSAPPITSDRDNPEEFPSSAVELAVKEKYRQKMVRQERVVEEVKMALKPFYNRREINKDEYKDVMRKAVPKICHNRLGEINPLKIKSLVGGYVKKLKHQRKHLPSTTS